MKRLLLLFVAVLVLIPSTASGLGRTHFGSKPYEFINVQDDHERQGIVIYVNRHDVTHDWQAVFNYDTDQGPCEAGRMYADTVILYWRLDSGHAWQSVSTNYDQTWHGTQGDACPGADRFVSSPFVQPPNGGELKAEATFRIDWASPHDNITGFITRSSFVVT